MTSQKKMTQRIRKLLHIPSPVQAMGAIDRIDGATLLGWATTNRYQSVSVDIAIDGTALSSTPCNLFREDLKNAGVGDGCHGFALVVPADFMDGGMHVVTAHVTVDRQRHLLDKIKLSFAVSGSLERELLPHFLAKLKRIKSLSQQNDAVAIIGSDNLTDSQQTLMTPERPIVLFAFASDDMQIQQTDDSSGTSGCQLTIPAHRRERYYQCLRDSDIRFDEVRLAQMDFAGVQLAWAISHSDTRLFVQSAATIESTDGSDAGSPGASLSEIMAAQQLAQLPDNKTSTPDAYRWAHPVPHTENAPLKNVLLIWKQHDAGLYGRRVDQVARAMHANGFRVTCLEIMVPTQLRQYMVGAANTASDHGYVLHDFYRKQYGFTENGIHYRTLYLDAMTQPTCVIQTFLMENGILPTNSVAIVFPAVPHWVSVLKALEPYTKICDIVDNQLSWTPEQPSELLTQYQTSIAASDAVVFNSAKNAQYFTDLNYLANKLTVEIPNWYMVPDNFEPVTTAQAHSSDSVSLIYSGNMNDRMDFALLKKVITTLPFSVRVHLVGSGQHAKDELMDCLANPGIIYHGPLRESALLGLLAQCDIAIMPHLNDNCSSYMNPLKVHMYAAMGIPCVSTTVAGVDFTSSGIYEGTTHDAFLQHITHIGKNVGQFRLSRSLSRQVGACDSYIQLVGQLLHRR
ncbi:MAG: glycosyltransferase family 4 protein [Deltaproteobacteria bacterium]|nr:glycosyltransferase family 4 protein [Deltaproteobacteria bacterium]